MPRGGKREGAGLKPKGEEPITETLAIRVTPSEKDMIKTKASNSGLSIGRYIVKKCTEDDDNG